ncbi:hypothetical protein CV767_23480 [Salmonella enterica subsp. enterica serovar Typhi]|nr:hypothetical protein CV766_23405 [Salmonella enterica subsp. enterica serovar Typhi]PJM45828.1 hypothetical protein CV767_23480 [Salmonella enterica subsp. enterica serovar Typhi]
MITVRILIINILRHSRRFSDAPVRLSYQPRPNRRIRSDICIKLRYLRPVNGLPGYGIDNCSPILSSSSWCFM